MRTQEPDEGGPVLRGGLGPASRPTSQRVMAHPDCMRHLFQADAKGTQRTDKTRAPSTGRRPWTTPPGDPALRSPAHEPAGEIPEEVPSRCPHDR